MQKFDSITHFLKIGGFKYRVYDMGRKVVQISNQRFQQIENQQEPYPYPFQHQAWLALLLWDKHQADHQQTVIWFIHFPLDELGCLQLQARDGFLLDLLQQAGKNLQAKQRGDSVIDELAESPYAFKPNTERQAMLHAIATREVKQPASRFYQFVRDYLKGDAGYEQWQFLGLQGIADVVARCDEDDNDDLLVKGISKMPSEPLKLFARMLEHIQPSAQVANELRERLTRLLEKGPKKTDHELLGSLLRGLSGDVKSKQTRKLIEVVLNSPDGGQVEILASVSGRAWPVLTPDLLLPLYLERLSEQEQSVFDALLTDLMRLPGMRDKVMQLIRDPERPAGLGDKLSVFLQGVYGTK